MFKFVVFGPDVKNFVLVRPRFSISFIFQKITQVFISFQQSTTMWPFLMYIISKSVLKCTWRNLSLLFVLNLRMSSENFIIWLSGSSFTFAGRIPINFVNIGGPFIFNPQTANVATKKLTITFLYNKWTTSRLAKTIYFDIKLLVTQRLTQTCFSFSMDLR